MSKFIFITGGVVSSLGKGIAAASIGKLLESRKISTTIIKCDPYLNVDAGTMSPLQHGEVFITNDGGETDLDLGHYERFIKKSLTKDNCITSGQIYKSVIQKERKGKFLGQTVQIIPHITDEIKYRLTETARKSKADVVIVELGGTVGDIEGLPFLEAIRQMNLESKKEDVINMHMTLIPYIKAAEEQKTKPTQHSVGQLRSIGLNPDIIMCRAENKLSESERAKIALFCNIDKNYIINNIDVEFIYELPLELKKEKIDQIILKKLKLKGKDQESDKWKKNVVDRLKNPKYEVNIAIVGKYTILADAYKSLFEALVHAGIKNNTRVNIIKIDSEKIGNRLKKENIQGILVPGGFGQRGVEGKISAIKYARENKIPFFGICFGLQIACVEFARNVCNLKEANSTEVNKNTKHPIISNLLEQKACKVLDSAIRLGANICKIKKNTLAFKIYKKEKISERHRHRYEFDLKYKKMLEKRGLSFSGYNIENKAVEIIEISNHPWFIACQFHPEFQSKPDKAHPLFVDFIKNCLQK